MLKKLLNLLLILLAISIVNGGNLFPKRILTEKQIQLNQASHLKFNDDSKWEFEIDYTSTEELTIDATEYLSILFKGEASKAACKVSSNIKLSCVVEAITQTRADLVQLNPELSEGATIKFNNLAETTDIAIETKLNYQDSYSLTYNQDGDNKWKFKVKLMETDILPENGLVSIDVFFYSDKAIVVDCKHKQHYLYCESSESHKTYYLFQISPIKISGTVEWENIIANMTIPLYSSLKIYIGGSDLELIDGRWNYVLSCRGENLGAISTLITLNTKIVKKADNKEYYHLTRCYSKGIQDATLFNCIVEGDNHEITDLVFVSPKADINDISIEWGSRLTSDDVIIRKAELTFVNAYDLEYSNHKWIFKIKVKDDENLPEKAKVNIDLVNGANNGVTEYPCSFEKHILSCMTSISTISMLKLQAEKEKGSVIWNGIKEKRIPIPLIGCTTFKEAFGAFFTDKWNFLIKASFIDHPAQNSTVIIDILHNEKETTATCAIGRITNNIGYIYCVSDEPNQKATDTIKMNPENTYGSFYWKEGLNELNNNIALASVASDPIEDQITFNDANNMFFSGNKWHFSIQGRSTESSYTFGIYKVDIKIKRSSGESENGIANCFLYNIFQEFYLNMICSCEYSNQNKEDLIKIAYEKTESSTIKWKSGLTSDYSIALNAALTFKNANKLKKESNVYTFQVNLEEDNEAILPLNSKLIVDVALFTSGIAECTVNTKTLLLCTVKDYTGASEPRLKYYKSEKGSVIWKNENRKDYVIILEQAKLELLSVNYLYFTEGKWHFQIKQKSVEVGSVLMDVSYGGEKVSATCTGSGNNLMNCILNDQIQDKKKLVRLIKTQYSTSTITWTNLSEDKDIPLKTDLTLDRTGNLKVVDDDNGKTWVFDIFIKDKDIPENALIIVDIYIKLPNKIVKSLANCYHSNKILKCSVIPKDYIDNNNYLYLLKEKDPNTISSVTYWDNMEKMKTLIESDTVILYNLDYNYATKINDENSQKVFYVEISKTTPLEVDKTYIIDILIEAEPKLSQCQALSTTKLRCLIASGDSITNKKVYIAKTSTSSSTTRWNNLEENQILTPIRLTYKRTYDINSVSDHEYKFNIEVSGTDLKNNLILPVEIFHVINGKKADATQTENKQIVPCKSTNNALLCDWFSESIVINSDNDLIQLMLKETGEIVEWTNPGKYDVNREAVASDKKEDNPVGGETKDNSDKKEENTNKSDATKDNSDKKEGEPVSTDGETGENEPGNEDKGNKNSFENYLEITKVYLLLILVII